MDTNQTDVRNQQPDHKSNEEINEGHKDDQHHPAFPKQIVEEPHVEKPEVEVPDTDPDTTIEPIKAG